LRRTGAPTTVLLFSDHPEAAQVPQSVVVPAGQLETTFTITSNAAALPAIAQITAWLGTPPHRQSLGQPGAASQTRRLRSPKNSP
jgi:hypothetical protein